MLLLAQLGCVFAEPIEVGARPESITKGFGGDFFVSVMGNQNVPGDAVVRRIDSEGKVTDFAGGMDEPKGIAFVSETLVVSDLGRVWAIDSQGKATVLAHRGSFPNEVRYLNDVAAVPNEDAVYVTDMGSNTLMFESPGKLWALDSEEAGNIPNNGRVYKITLEGKVTEVVPGHPDMRNPNGVGVGKDGDILIASFFTGKISSFKDGKLTTITEGFRGADAIEQDEEGVYYFSSWTQGKVWSYEPSTQKVTVLKEGLESAADFYFDRESNQLLCPDMLAGKVYTIPLR